LVVAGACADGVVAAGTGNAELGIARFATTETADLTTVIGLDEAGGEVARLELVHGEFTVSDGFKADFDTPVVIGRALSVRVNDLTLQWETMGFEPVLEMPAHPPSQRDIGIFLESPSVAPILARWQIGFLKGAGGSEQAYAYDTHYMWPPIQTGSGTTPRGTYNVCAGSGGSAYGGRRNFGGGSEELVAQCCPDNKHAYKTCPYSPTTGAASSGCGTTGATAVCKGCAEYGSGSSCGMFISYDGAYQYDNYTTMTLMYTNVVAYWDQSAPFSPQCVANGNTCPVEGNEPACCGGYCCSGQCSSSAC
jgi:hypothetical protein